MKEITLFSLFIVMLSGLVFSQDENLNVDKLMMNAYRALMLNSSGDNLLQTYNNLEYFYCEGSGTTEMRIEGILQDELTSNTRTEFVFAFQDVDRELQQTGLFAISEPTMLGDGWLVVSAKFLDDTAWKNVWDAKFSYENSNNPLENAAKGTVNDFILRFDINQKNESENWKSLGNGMLVSDVSLDTYSTMNRKTLKFFHSQISKKLGKSNEFTFNTIEKTSSEGDCSVVKR